MCGGTRPPGGWLEGLAQAPLQFIRNGGEPRRTDGVVRRIIQALPRLHVVREVGVMDTQGPRVAHPARALMPARGVDGRTGQVLANEVVGQSEVDRVAVAAVFDTEVHTPTAILVLVKSHQQARVMGD